MDDISDDVNSRQQDLLHDGMCLQLLCINFCMNCWFYFFIFSNINNEPSHCCYDVSVCVFYAFILILCLVFLGGFLSSV